MSLRPSRAVLHPVALSCLLFTLLVGSLTATVGLSALPANAAGTPKLNILVLGDSYSAGNGAGDYAGPSGCYRSPNNYAQLYAKALRAAPRSESVTVTNAACSGAVTANFTEAQHGVPRQLDAVNTSYDEIFLTIGGNDASFADIVKFCLIAKTRDGANCNPLLSQAESLISSGTMKQRITQVLQSIHGQANPNAKIVLIGYPELEGDASYTLRSGHGTNAPIIAVGKRLRAIQASAESLQASIVSTLNAGLATKPYIFQSVQSLFNGPPYHGLYAKKNNSSRWMVQPFVDASILTRETWYHPNPTGWAQEAALLAAAPNIPNTSTQSISTTVLSKGQVAVPYSAQLATDGDGVGTWGVSGALPPGLTQTGSLISGTPSASGLYQFTLEFTDRFGRSASKATSISVDPATGGGGNGVAFTLSPTSGLNGTGSLATMVTACPPEPLSSIPVLHVTYAGASSQIEVRADGTWGPAEMNFGGGRFSDLPTGPNDITAVCATVGTGGFVVTKTFTAPTEFDITGPPIPVTLSAASVSRKGTLTLSASKACPPGTVSLQPSIDSATLGTVWGSGSKKVAANGTWAPYKISFDLSALPAGQYFVNLYCTNATAAITTPYTYGSTAVQLT